MTRIFLFTLLLHFTYSNSSAQDIFQMPKGVQSRLSSEENHNGIKGSGGKTNGGAKGSAMRKLQAGDSATLLSTDGAGIIQRIWITISDRSPQMLRNLHLYMYWDGSKVAAVDVPLGDFFCAPLGKPTAFESAFFSNPEGRSFNCYIPMPFKKSARIVLVNQAKVDLELLFYDVDFVQSEKWDADQLYFHASWNRQSSSVPGQDFVILPTINGKGRFLGTCVGVNIDSTYGETWWGEGEVKMYLDGDSAHPTINGTGAEDYIGTGWSEGRFAHRYQGCLTANARARQYEFYRFHIPDAIWFYQNCKVTIQQIGGWFAQPVRDMINKGVPLKPVSLSSDKKGFRGLINNPAAEKEIETADADEWLNFYRSDDYAATAYYYLDKP